MGRRRAKTRHLTMRTAALSVVRQLQDAGHVAYFAGGCVRDMLMGRRPHDYDVATEATPTEVIAMFPRTQKVGAKFGVVLVRLAKFVIEVATFRTDLDYEDGRHPTDVRFTDACHDAARRDFTINGMFYDPIARTVVDYVGGEDDLKSGLIRAIGEPERRFAEDHLRILRAIRFATRFDFTIDAATWNAMRANASAITKISPERIGQELAEILSHANRAAAFRQLCDANVMEHLWPSAAALTGLHEQIATFLSSLTGQVPFELALAVMLHALSPSGVTDACRGLRCSNTTERTVTWLTGKQDVLDDPARVTTADLKLLMANQDFELLLKMWSAKLRATGRSSVPYRTILARAREIPRDEVAPPPLIDGHDLKRLGLRKGPIYKIVLDKVYYGQLNGDITDRASATAFAEIMAQQAER